MRYNNFVHCKFCSPSLNDASGLEKVVARTCAYAADGAQNAIDACDNGMLFASKDWAKPEYSNNNCYYFVLNF